MKATHRLMLTVEVAGPMGWNQAWNALNKAMVSAFMPPYVQNCSVSSFDLEFEDDEPGETHTGDTLSKVTAALRESGLEEQQITDAVSSMQNYGILFRERSS